MKRQWFAGRWVVLLSFVLLVSLFGRGEATSASIHMSDVVGSLPTFVAAYYDGIGLDGANSLAISPDGSRVYVTGHGDDALAVLDRDVSSGELAYVGLRRDNTGGVHGVDGAAGVTVSPDGDHLYVAGEWDDAVVIFAVSASNRVYLPLVVREAQ